jgi:hypothetical protein
MKKEHIWHHVTPLDKTNSSFQKDVNRLKKKCHEYQRTIAMNKNFKAQALSFIDVMLKANRITKEDLKPYFKKKRDCIL